MITSNSPHKICQKYFENIYRRASKEIKDGTKTTDVRSMYLAPLIDSAKNSLASSEKVADQYQEEFDGLDLDIRLYSLSSRIISNQEKIYNFIIKVGVA